MLSALTTRRSAASLSVWLVVGAIAVLMALLIGTIAHTLKHVQPVRSKTPPLSAVVWGDLVFSSPGALAHWLKVRGVGYSVWAQRHPPADHVLKRQKHKTR